MRPLLATVIALAAILSAWGASAGSPGLGETAPAITVQTLDGKTFDLAARRGRVVVVNIWATWCPPCRAEMPALDAYYRAFHDRGVDLIALSADRSHDTGEVRRAMRQFGYPAAMLARARPNGFGTPTNLPVTYLIDKDGRIRAVFGGTEPPLTSKALSDATSALLEVRKGP